MSLESATSRAFTTATRELGKKIHKSRNVELVETDQFTQALFYVTGTRPYRVNLDYTQSKNQLEIRCTCPHYADGFLCKHSWAAILSANQSGLLPAAGAHEKVLVAHEHELEDALQAEELQTLPGFVAGTPSEDKQKTLDVLGSKASTPKSAWRKVIDSAEEKVVALGFQGNPTRTRLNRSAPHFALDLQKLKRDGKISLQFLFRDQLKDGGSGPMRSAEISQDSIATFADPADQQLLWTVFGPARLEGPYSGYTSYSRGSTNAVLPASRASAVLNQISQAKRLWAVIDWKDYRARWEPISTESYSFSEDRWSVQLKLSRLGDSYSLTSMLTDGKLVRRPQEILASLDELIFFADFVAPSSLSNSKTWLEVFKNQIALTIPADELDGFLEFYYDGQAQTALELPDDVKFEERGDFAPDARLTFSNVLNTKTVRARLDMKYDDLYISASSPQKSLVDVPARRILNRDITQELKFIEEFWSIGGGTIKDDRTADPASRVLREQDFFTAVEKGIAFGWEVVANQRAIRRPKDFAMSVSSGVDWFDLNADFNFDGITEKLPYLLKSLKSGERLLPLGDGTFGLLPMEWFEKFGPIAEMARATEDGLRLSKVQMLFLGESLEEHFKLRPDQKFNSLKTLMDDFRKAKPVNPGPGFKGVLRAYQNDGLSWLSTLAKHEIGGVLADDMGLGKTIQVLALLESARKESTAKERRPSLIVAPKSLVFNWMKEAEKFTPSLTILDHTGTGRHFNFEDFGKYDVVITTYQTLRIDIEAFKRESFNFFILDEAHFIKNPEAQASLACRLITAKKKIALSGTPVENSLSDIFSILAVVNPGLVSDVQSQKWAKTTEPEKLKTLARALRPFILRRTKEEVLKDLPEKSEQILYCDLSAQERRKYNELKAYYWSNLSGRLKEKGLARSKIEILEALLRLRQASCHQGLLDPKLSTKSSAKFELLLEQIESVIADGHKALIFSQFTTLLGLLSTQLKKRKIKFEYLDGKTSNRSERVENFQTDDSIKLFLLSLKAGGVGLNLTAADYVFVLDPWWNPAAEAQAVDRAHRIGQTKKVFAYKLIARGTVEEKILELQNAKKSLANAIISGDESLLKALSMDDLKALFE